MKNDLERANLVSLEAVSAAWADICRHVRQGLQAAPQRVLKRLPNLSHHDLAVLTEQIQQVAALLDAVEPVATHV
jgi:phage terminase Nu1 subunit (DNA packaging protein)